MNDYKRTGATTELEVMAALLRAGCSVSFPYGDCEEYDLIADLNGRLLRVQVKTPKTYDDGRSIQVDFRRGTKHLHYDENNLEYFATSYNGQAYLFPADGRRARRLRLEPTKHGQVKRTTWAVEFELERVIKELSEEASK